MFHLKYFIYSILFRLIIATPQLNLLYTDWVSESDNDLQHNCLRINVNVAIRSNEHEMISYCLSELPSKFKIENNDFGTKFTFVQLSEQNISSQQLYLWSAPIDLIERYQFYLNQLSISNGSFLSTDIVYNCTMPRFGPKCQYELHYHYSNHESLYEMISAFYVRFPYNPTTLTCYTHLQCNRGPVETCLDWTEICNGQIDCLDGGLDEEYCWELEINQCKENEYRCKNGQCIPKPLNQDEINFHDCIDLSGILVMIVEDYTACQNMGKPTMKCEEQMCRNTGFTSSCLNERLEILAEAMYSTKDSSVSENCWSAFQCLHNLPDSNHLSCDKLCRKKNACIQIVNNYCPDFLYLPSVPVLFGDLYFAVGKNTSQNYTKIDKKSFYICYKNSHYDDYFINSSKILFKNMTCVHPEQLLSTLNYLPSPSMLLKMNNIFETLYAEFKRYYLNFNYNSTICNRSNIYQCINSIKCIPVYRLFDGEYDCPFMDDENINAINNIAIIEQLKQTHFKCQATNKYIVKFKFQNVYCDCGYNEMGFCEDEDLQANYLQKNIVFQHICDGFVDLLPIMIGEQNETDETECEQWKCNNIYTRCNRRWNCPNGLDESGCFSYSTLNCSLNNHFCVSPDTNQLMCSKSE